MGHDNDNWFLAFLLAFGDWDFGCLGTIVGGILTVVILFLLNMLAELLPALRVLGKVLLWFIVILIPIAIFFWIRGAVRIRRSQKHAEEVRARLREKGLLRR